MDESSVLYNVLYEASYGFRENYDRFRANTIL